MDSPIKWSDISFVHTARVEKKMAKKNGNAEMRNFRGHRQVKLFGSCFFSSALNEWIAGCVPAVLFVSGGNLRRLVYTYSYL